jgi:TonB-dependent SusC/RagA subfamily outer membrane receptor
VQGGTKPLILVDGIEVRATDINSLDLSNIDRVEVVKGAASATLYGAQGANGVIQIFTKKGKVGKAVVSFNTSYSANQYINSGDVHKARMHPYLVNSSGALVDVNGNPLTYDQYGSVDGIAYEYGGTVSASNPTGAYAARAGIWSPLNNAIHPYLTTATVHYVDQFKEVFQTGSTTNNVLSISGATDKSDYSISVTNNHTISPVMQNGYVDRSNLTANLGTEVFKGFKIRSITQLIYTKNTLVPGLGAAGGIGYGYGNSQGNVGAIYGFLNTSPFLDLKYKLADGTYANHVLGGAYLSVNSSNPFYAQEYSTGLDNKVDIVQNFDASLKINKFFDLDAKYGINFRNENAKWTYYNQSNNINSNFYQSWNAYENGNDNTGEIDNFQYNTTFQNFLASANFKTDLQNDFHSKLPISLATKVAFDWRKNVYREYDTWGYSLPLVPPFNIASTAAQHVSDDYVEPFVTYGYLVDQSINFGDYAGLDGGFRSDWSSAFGSGATPFTFPRINGFFAPSAFDFWRDKVSFINYFKVRAAYGEAGIQPGAFQRYAVINQQDIGQTLTYSLQPSPTFNTKLNVEVSKETEVGADFSITGFKGKWLSAFNVTFTDWMRKGFNNIYPVSVPLSSGQQTSLLNSITMSSHGWEFSLNIPVFKSKNASWDFTTNWGHQTSKINTIVGNEPVILTTSAGSSALILSPNTTIGQLYGHKTITSLNQTDPNGNLYIPKSDDAMYTMVGGAVVNIATKQIQYTPDKYDIGDPNPKFNSSFINTINYKFVTLSFQIDWIHGSHTYNQTKEWMSRDGISGDFEKQVNIDGQKGAWSAYWSSPYYNILGSTHGGDNDGTRDYYYENSSFARLRNVSLAFDITRAAKIKYFKTIQLIFSGRNLVTITKYTGFDPEMLSTSANSAFDRGVDNSTIPNIKSYQVGLKIIF